MNGLFFLLCCIEILGALLCGAQTATEQPATANFSSTENATSTVRDTQTTSVAVITSLASTKPTTVSETSRPPPTPGPKHTTTMTTSTTTTTATTRTTTRTTTSPFIFNRKECFPAFMVAGGLIIACFILLLSTLFLMCKVCQLNRRIKMLSSNADLISTHEYWMGTAQRNKNAPETEAKETTVLMSDMSQTQEEMGNGTAKAEEGGKVKEDGQTAEEEKKTEVVEEPAKSEEASPAPVADAEKASSEEKKPVDSKSTEAAAASEGTEEPKGVV